MNDCYFNYKNKRYVINIVDYDYKIYRIKDNKRVNLTEEENKDIDELFNNKYSYIYESVLLNNIINENDKIEEKDLVIKILEWLESIIPDSAKEKFYKNLSSVKLSMSINKLYDDVDLKDNYPRGRYYTKENKIEIPDKTLSFLLTKSKYKNDNNELFWNDLSHILLHEFIHMASTKYDSSKEVVESGFDLIPTTRINMNRGLTEAYTEFLASIGSPQHSEGTNGYFIEVCLLGQLIQITGNDIFLNSYFNNEGTKPIENKLNKLIDNSYLSFALFRNFEMNFVLGDKEEKGGLVYEIQMTILDYLDKKLELLVGEGKFEMVKKILLKHESLIIDSKKLKEFYESDKDYSLVDRSVERFEKLKEKYIDYLGYEKVINK